MITLERASRWYGQVVALNDVTCTVGTGITALLGPNGAGKSTMLKLVTGQIRPTTGSVKVLNHLPFANSAVYRRLGYVPELESAYEEQTGRQFVTFMAALAGIPAIERSSRVAAALEKVAIAAAADRKMGGYSKGMRQRVKVAQAIVHDPEVLILDEPLNGLDPVGRRDIGNILLELGSAGKCIIISSHILHEVEHLTRNILLLHKGRLLAQGDIYAIRSLIDKHPHKVQLECGNARQLAMTLVGMESVISVRMDRDNRALVEIETPQPDRFYAELPGLVENHNLEITAFHSPDNNLEAVFNYLVQS